ncbi:hypothetical protein PBRA_008312 [Plasmodiophora brassicae]|uniref:Uncharacterized protein n=1 Tax=Plasmodiophora brassicae TaxID=37360 RepID=A0A0G4J089_PLABS|nr:hypothetical protein PBRA_008312 [Plasmodiophora brassicae]
MTSPGRRARATAAQLQRLLPHAATGWWHRATWARRRLVSSRPGPRHQAPLSAYQAFLRSPSVPLAVRALKHDADPQAGWDVFQHVVSSPALAPRIPFFQAMLMFCRRRLPGKAPDVLRAALDRGVAVNDTLFCTFVGACRAADPPLCQDVVDLYARCGPRSHNVIASVANVCRLAKQPGPALGLLQDAVDGDVEFGEVLTSVLSACCADARSAAGADVAQRLVDLVRSGRIPAYAHNQAIFGNLIKALLSQARFDAAVDVTSVMEGVGVAPSSVTYTLLLSSLIRAAQLSLAMSVFERMAGRRVAVGVPVFASLVAACKRADDARRHLAVLYDHALANPALLLHDDFAACSLISAFDAVGHLATAEAVFARRCAASVPDAPVFMAMMTAYVRHSRSGGRPAGDVVGKALSVFASMVEHGVPVDGRAFTALVSACRGYSLPAVQRLHDYATGSPALLDDDFVVSAFISAYADCDAIVAAEQTFQARCASGRPAPGECVFSAMVAAYTRHGMFDEGMRAFEAFRASSSSSSLSVEAHTTALSLFSKAGRIAQAMSVFETALRQGVRVDGRVVAELVTACRRGSCRASLDQVHRHASDRAYLMQDDRVVSALIAAYSCTVESLAVAEQVFARRRAVGAPGVVVFNAMISAYGGHGRLANATAVFDDLKGVGVPPNDVTLCSLLSACNQVGAVRLAMSIVDEFERAWRIPPRSLETCTTLLSLYSRGDCLAEAFALLDAMVQSGTPIETLVFCGLADAAPPAFACVVAAYGRLSLAADLRRLHRVAESKAFLSDAFVVSALAASYGRCADWASVRAMHDVARRHGLMGDGGVVNALISAYGQCGDPGTAERLFVEGRSTADPSALSTVVAAYGRLSQLADLRRLHQVAAEESLLAQVAVVSAFISSYAQCGQLAESERLFRDLAATPDTSTFNAMIAAYSHHARLTSALDTYERLQRAGLKPNDVTLVSLLTACSHVGDLQRALAITAEFTTAWGIRVDARHTNCLVDLHARMGNLDEAERFIGDASDVTSWMTVLGACRKHDDLARAERVFATILSLPDSPDVLSHLPAAYVLMSNVYAANGRLADVQRLRRAMRARGLTKVPGQTSLLLPDRTVRFVCDDDRYRSDAGLRDAHGRMLEDLRASGYTPDLGVVTRRTSSADEARASVCRHSEKLAIAYALAALAPGEPIYATNNLRVCPDCHEATKRVSALYARDIYIRDANRHHHFRDGHCSCGDYW